MQPAALTQLLRRACDAVGIDIDDLRKAAVTASGGEQRDLQKLRRVTWGGLLTVVLLFIAGNVLISGLIDIGIDTIVDAIQQASIPILIVAFCISCLGRFSNAVALSGMSPTPIPLGRLTALQFAMTFVGPGDALDRRTRRRQHPLLPARSASSRLPPWRSERSTGSPAFSVRCS